MILHRVLNPTGINYPARLTSQTPRLHQTKSRIICLQVSLIKRIQLMMGIFLRFGALLVSLYTLLFHVFFLRFCGTQDVHRSAFSAALIESTECTHSKLITLVKNAISFDY